MITSLDYTRFGVVFQSMTFNEKDFLKSVPFCHIVFCDKDGEWKKLQEPIFNPGVAYWTNYKTPDVPLNLPPTHKAYRIIWDGRPAYIHESSQLLVVGHCVIRCQYLYGFCDDDASICWPCLLGTTSKAKWALFRDIEYK